MPTLLNKGVQTQHEYLYWEFGNGKLAVRKGDYKYVNDGNNEFLYNLAADIDESDDIKGDNQAIFDELKALAAASSTDPLTVVWDAQLVDPPDWEIAAIETPGKKIYSEGYVLQHFRKGYGEQIPKKEYNILGRQKLMQNEGVIIKKPGNKLK